ncbi:MAG: hypothetical protein H5T98_07565 [Syntrophomonadaceae bacterium]|nr:hypothetical protein [Syntrophomonadaceae bacterium]
MANKFFYAELMNELRKLVEEKGLFDEEVLITGRILSEEEAIGSPQRRDYPLLKGKERLMEADFKGAKGQAFTDMAGNFNGTLKEVLDTPLKTNFDRAVLIATANAVCRYLGLVENTVHCHDEEPEECASRLVEQIKQRFGAPKIALIGLQPAILEKLGCFFSVRVVDLDLDNIGKIKSGVLIEGPEAADGVLQWCDLIVATGSTAANGSIVDYYDNKQDDRPVIFFGTTIAAASALMGLERFCPLSS